MQFAKAGREQMILPTYPVGPANINPIISTNRHEKPYPYLMLDSLTDKKQDLVYEALVIENEYLKVTVLPDLGAKLYSAFDKRNQKQVFYHNRVVKPQLVGMTGAWTSGGIEFNFPRAHRPSTMQKIETFIRENKDGSASIFLGEIDKSTGLRFSVELILHPGRSYIEQAIHIFNSTSLPQRFYFWNTASYPETNKLECRYPSKWMIREGDRHRCPWPFDGDVDVRWCENIQGFAAIFTSRSDQDFFGLYDRTLEQGTIHVANHREVPGKKLWSWGRADAGVMWNQILTDEDGPYVEYQSGNVQTQVDFTYLQPFQHHNWKEYWYQAIKTGPFTFANKYASGTTRFERGSGDKLYLYLSILMNETFNQATFKIVHSGDIVFEKFGDWSPDCTLDYKIELTYHSLVQGTLRLQFVSQEGILLFDHAIRKNRSAIDEIETIPEIQKSDDVTTHMAQIDRAEGRAKYAESIRLLNQLLENHPYYLEAYLRKAINQIKMLDFESAQKTIDHALTLTPLSNELNYYAGLIGFLRGNYPQAKSFLLEVNDVSSLSAPASILLGKIALREQENFKALQYFEKAALSNTNVDVLLGYALRKLCQNERARFHMEHALESDPLNIVASVEYDLGFGSTNSKVFIRNNIHNLLHVVEFYEEIGDREAQQYVLKNYSDPTDPLVLYQLGYLESIAGNTEKAISLYLSAEQQSPDWVFPVSNISMKALQDAVKKLGMKGTHSHYYLGLVYHAKERYTDAEQMWRICVEATMKYSVLYRNLGNVLIKKGDTDGAISILEMGLALPPENTEIRLYLNNLYKAKGLIEKRMALLPNNLDLEKLDPSYARMLTSIYNDTNQFDKSIEILTTYQFRVWEIEENADIDLKKLYREAWLGKAYQLVSQEDWDAAIFHLEQSTRYPKNTQLAKSPEQDDTLVYYMMAVCLEKKGDFDKALYYCDLIAESRKTDKSKYYNEYIKAINMKLELEWLGFAPSVPQKSRQNKL